MLAQIRMLWWYWQTRRQCENMTKKKSKRGDYSGAAAKAQTGMPSRPLQLPTAGENSTPAAS